MLIDYITADLEDEQIVYNACQQSLKFNGNIIYLPILHFSFWLIPRY